MEIELVTLWLKIYSRELPSYLRPRSYGPASALPTEEGTTGFRSSEELFSEASRGARRSPRHLDVGRQRCDATILGRGSNYK